jgi:predicted GIY-YIG superfamily endonuclease
MPVSITTRPHVIGSVYLLHLDAPFGPPHQQARHYLGFARDLEARLAHHAAGTGANLLRHVRAAGIGWTLARVWEGKTRAFERSQKRNGHAKRCPICRAAARERRRQQPRLFDLRAGAMRPAATA